MSGSANRTGVIPACLSFLAIYNPSLSTSEESLHDQIVYYHSKAEKHRTGRKSSSNAETEQEHQEKNERLRQIGLAQGMVEFAKSFSDGEAVDSIETEKSRIILHELEPTWWILVSVDLTRITSTPDKSSIDQQNPVIEHSAREVASPALLLQQVLRAHRTFLLHHAANLGELYTRLTRSKFCTVLKRFWNRFVSNWDVLLNGNPALDLFNGLKLASGGELGIGVGEEEWGSGEREVLEGFIGRTGGLVDMIVSRFGDAPIPVTPEPKATEAGKDQPVASSVGWAGDGQHPRPSDGVIFSGIGAITRSSIRDVSSWGEDLFRYGQDTYGLRDNPSSLRWRRRGDAELDTNASQRTYGSRHQGLKTARQKSVGTQSTAESRLQSPEGHGIPRPIVGMGRSVSNASNLNSPLKAPAPQVVVPDNAKGQVEAAETGTETMIKYLTLGVYGSKWGIPFRRQPENPQVSKILEDGKARSASPAYQSAGSLPPDEMPGCFLIGFRGDLESSVEDDEQEEETGEERANRISDENQSSRTMLRTLYISRLQPKGLEASISSDLNENEQISLADSFPDRLRVVVYVHQPFMFICLFELQTDTLAIPAFYRSIHHQLGPLQRPLLVSTAPDKASARLWEASLPKSTASTRSSQPIGDLVYDPTRLTIHTTIPNIPDPGTSPADSPLDDTAPWSRVEALNVYSQILSIYESTRRRKSELERTCKTSRGWWVVWMRLPDATQPTNPDLYREAFLIRKASDYTAPKARKASARFGRDVNATSSNWGPGKLAEGIGIDTKQYIEGLLTLNR